MTILKKGLLLIAVPLCFQLIFLVMVGVMRRRATTAEKWMVQTKLVFVQSRTVQYQMLNAHGTVQGYYITRDPVFEQRAADRLQVADDEAAKLRRMVSDNPVQRDISQRIEDGVRRFTAYLRQGVGLIRAGRMDAAMGVDRRRIAQDMLDATNRDLGAFLAEEHRLDLLREQGLAGEWARLDLLLVGAMVLSVLATVIVAILFSRSISGRISVLADNASRLAEGREMAPALGGRDEIAALDGVFHEMAATLDAAARSEREHARVTALRAEELAQLNEQLREKNQENEMFVYSVSHDLRSPLVNLQGFSKELGLIGKDLRSAIDRDEVPASVRTRAVGLIDVDIAESIGFIQTAVTRLSAIIDALLRLSRAGRVEYRAQDCDVEAIVRRVVSALNRTITEKGAAVTVGELPAAHGDPTALEQVFGNLLGNALNYLDPARPGVIRVERDRDQEGSAAAPEGSVVYAVRDNGLGIADAYKGKVFSAFQRLHGDIARGEGIGLALTRRVVERHGGRIWFESAAGQGSTFYVAIPPAANRGRDEPGVMVSSSTANQPSEG